MNEEVLNNKIADVKAHVVRNKKFYVAGAAGFLAGVITRPRLHGHGLTIFIAIG